MNKIFIRTIFTMALFFLMGFECEDHISSQNRPYQNQIDTTQITYLDVPVNVSISVLVREYDSSTQKLIPSIGATVHFDSTTIIDSTDSTGYANGIFQTKSIPFKYGYEVNKNGFNILVYRNWEKSLEIVDKATIYKTN